MRTGGRMGLALLTLAMLALPWRLEAGTMVADVLIGDALPGATLSGTNPYLYDFVGDSLEMAGFKVSSPITATRNVVLTNLTALTDSGGTGAIHTFTSSSLAAGYARVYASSGLTLGGSVLTYGRGGGAVTLAGGNISVSNINARALNSTVAGGAVTLTATGTVAVGGYITTGTAGSGPAGNVSITSGASIVVGGTTNGFSIEAATANNGGSVSLWATNVVLAGGIAANGSSGGTGNPGKAITIHDGSGGPARLVIGGSLLTYGGGGGAVTVVAHEISVTNIDTRSYSSAAGGAVTLTATGTVAVGGYITTAGSSGAAGNVSITSGASIVVGGTTNGFSIEAGSAVNTSGGFVSLWATNVVLAGGIAANGNTTGLNYPGKAVTIHDGSGGPARVAIGGSVNTYGGGGGAVSVTATDFSISNINTRSFRSNAAGAVTLTATGPVAVNGYITSANSANGDGGAVSITADGSVTVAGTTNGVGIETRTTQTLNSQTAGNITIVSTNGDITVTGGFDASHGYGVTRRGAISLSATNGSITVGSLNTNLFKTISLQAGTGTYNSIEVTGVLTNFGVSESPKRFTFPTNCVIGNDIYYSFANNGAGLSGTYDIYVATQDTGKDLKEGPPPAPGGTPATIANLPVTNVTTTGATFKGYLEVVGAPVASVYVCWGQTNGSAGNNWAYTNSWTAGAWGAASSPVTNISPLTANRNYYFTFGALNTASNVVATPVQYFITGALGIQVTDGSCGTNVADTGAVVVSRPDTCTNEALPVYYSLGGAEQYVTGNPASGFEIAKGETQRTITLQPRVPNWGSAANFTVALLPGPYPSASLASVAVTVEPAVFQDLTLAGDATVGANMDVVETPPDIVSATGSNPYTYDFWTASLNMAGYKIAYNAGQRNVVLTNLTELTDSGGTAIIDTSRAVDLQNAGFAKIHASSRVALGGYIKTSAPVSQYAYDGGAVVVAAPSIDISGTMSGLSIDSRGTRNAGAVTLLATNVVLAGGIAANGNIDYGTSGGTVTIHDGAGGPARVEIGGSVDTYNRKGNGVVTVAATDFSVLNINTRSYYEYDPAGAVTVTATGTVAVGGYITAANIGSGQAGAVSISAGGSITVGGTTNGVGIETRTTRSTDNDYNAGNITIVSTNGDITIAGGFDASHASGALARRGVISLSAANGRITVGGLDAAKFKSISVAAGGTVRVTGVITNFLVDESPTKKITFPAGSVIGSHIYYDTEQNTAYPLTGDYAIYVGTDTGKLLKEQSKGSVFLFR